MKKKMSFLMVLITMFSLMAPAFTHAAMEDTVTFVPVSYTYSQDNDSLKVEGFFVNTDVDAVDTVRSLDIVVYSGNGVIATKNMDIGSVEAVSIAPGSASKYRFEMDSPVPGGDVSTFWAESKVACNYGKPISWPTGKKVYYMGSRVVYDTPPTIINGRMMIPARYTFEKMGALVEWKAESQSVVVTREKDTVILYVGKAMMMVNGKPESLEVPAQIIDGRVLVPLRAIATALGANIVYGSKNEIAVIFE